MNFGELKGDAADLLAEHSAEVKQRIEKVGHFVGDKIGHDKVDGVEQKLTGLVDKLAGGRTAPPAAE